MPLDDFAIFDSLYPALRRFAAVVADADMDPDDLVQDALAATLSRRELHELEYPKAYLEQAIINVASNGRRRAGTLAKLLPRLRGDTERVDAYPSDISVLDQLAPLDRAVIYLADIDRLPHDLIATELAMTPAAVRKRVSRARKQLRQILGVELTALPSTIGDDE